MMPMVASAVSPSPTFVLCENDPSQHKECRNASFHKSRGEESAFILDNYAGRD